MESNDAVATSNTQAPVDAPAPAKPTPTRMPGEQSNKGVVVGLIVLIVLTMAGVGLGVYNMIQNNQLQTTVDKILKINEDFFVPDEDADEELIDDVDYEYEIVDEAVDNIELIEEEEI